MQQRRNGAAGRLGVHGKLRRERREGAARRGAGEGEHVGMCWLLATCGVCVGVCVRVCVCLSSCVVREQRGRG